MTNEVHSIDYTNEWIIYSSSFIQGNYTLFDYFPKQKQAIETLVDKTTKYFLYGGGAGGGKTWTGWEWLLWSSLAYPNIRSFVARKELKRLRRTTLPTFYKVCKKYNIQDKVHYKVDLSKDNVIKFTNGSQIDLLDVSNQPSDPEWERFGSYEYTFGWLEEAGEISFDAFDILKSRIGRQLNDEYNLTPKIYITCNPKRNWLYRMFYKPFVKNELPEDTKFLQSLVKDNPKVDRAYIDNLNELKDIVRKKRLRDGDWEYIDDPAKLMDSGAINEIFSNDWVEGETKFISADIARFGSDKLVIGVWEGYNLIHVETLAKSAVDESYHLIENLRVKHKISKQNVIGDDDGVGGGVNDMGKYQRFINAGKSFNVNGKETNYKSVADQCGYFMGELINEGDMLISTPLTETEKDEIIEELEVIKRNKPDHDGKLSLIPKKEIKELIGRSPDWWDMIKMRGWFNFKTVKNPTFSARKR